MSAPPERSVKPCVKDVCGKLGRYYSSAHRYYVSVVMLRGHLTRKYVVTYGSPYSLDFIRGYSYTDAGTAKYNSFIAFAVGYGFGNFERVIGIVYARRIVRAEVYVFYSSCVKSLDNGRF